MNRPAFISSLTELGLSLTEEQLGAFEAFEEDLYEANKVINLTRVSQEECWIRHFIDSLLLSPLIPQGSIVADIGCGPGFPAWPLACARPDLYVTAADSNQKMLGFLARHPLPNLEIANVRIEEWDKRDTFDVATGRAVAPLPIQLELCAPLVKIGGLVIPMRTPNDGLQLKELRPLGLEYIGVERKMLVDTGIERVFPIYRKHLGTNKRYPRSWPEIKNRPLT